MDAELKELLTLAAKACGHEVYGFYGDDEIETTFADIGPDHVVKFWAPHLDDGDAARMEGKLGIAYKWWPNCVYAFAYSEEELALQYEIEPLASHTEYLAEHNNDRQATRRWASLRVAAQIGGNMP